MESTEFLKLKDELTSLTRKEIIETLGRERDLQQKYVVLGLKIAGAGLVVGILSLGFFGIKTTSDINAAIDKVTASIEKTIGDEVRRRFETQNPVARYESLLSETSARAIAAAIEIKAARRDRFGLGLDDNVVQSVNDALKNNSITDDTKIRLLRAMILGDARSNTSAFGPTVLTLLRNTAKADPLNDLLLIECIHFLQANSPARYASDIEKIYQQYMTQKQIRIAVAKYGFTLDRNDGDRIIQLLESATDDDIRYLLHVRRLRLGLESKIDDTLLKNIISTAFDYRPGRAIRIGEILGHLAQINDENKTTLNARIQILNAIRTSAESNKMEFLAESTTSFDDDDDPDFFGFGTSSSRFGVSRKEFEGAFRAAVGLFAMNISQNGGTISESIIAHLRFWLPKAWRAGDALNYSGHLTLGDDPELLLETTDGQTLKRSTLPNVVVLTIAQKNGKDQLTAKWRDESDRVQISSIISMKDLSSESLRADGVWRKPTSRW